MNNIKKHKKLVFFLITIIILFIIIAVLISNKDKETTKEKILKKADYKVTDRVEKGTTRDDYTYRGDCTRYDKGSITIFVYEYDDFEMAREAAMSAHEVEKNMVTLFEDKENYTRREITFDEYTSCIRLAVHNLYISSWFETKDYEEVKKTIDDLLENELKNKVQTEKETVE